MRNEGKPWWQRRAAVRSQGPTLEALREGDRESVREGFCSEMWERQRMWERERGETDLGWFVEILCKIDIFSIMHPCTHWHGCSKPNRSFLKIETHLIVYFVTSRPKWHKVLSNQRTRIELSVPLRDRALNLFIIVGLLLEKCLMVISINFIMTYSNWNNFFLFCFLCGFISTKKLSNLF